MIFTGNHIKEIRTKLDLTQESLASEMDVNRATIVRWEGLGEEALPSNAQSKLMDFIKKRSKKDSNEKLAMPLLAGGLGALLGGPFGAMLGAGAAGILAKEASKDHCPWCDEKLSTIDGTEGIKNYICGKCDRPFRFVPGVGAIRLAL